MSKLIFASLLFVALTGTLSSATEEAIARFQKYDCHKLRLMLKVVEGLDKHLCKDKDSENSDLVLDTSLWLHIWEKEFSGELVQG
jgi:hypothetical protein